MAIANLIGNQGDASSRSKDTGSEYRPDIDGLRAIAVWSVILYHVSPKVLAGGYLGVDIFFVLSGLLITSILWREALQIAFRSWPSTTAASGASCRR